MKDINVAIIGLGNVGAALAKNMSRRGIKVLLAGRRPEAAQALAAELKARAVALSEAGAADVIFLAVPAAAAAGAISEAGGLGGRIVVDCTNPLSFSDGPVHAPPAEGSLTAQLAARFPAARLVKAFNTFGAELHERPEIA